MAQAYNTRDPITTQPQNLKLKFEVEELGEYTRKQRVGVRASDGITKGLVFADKVVTIPCAWQVYFPGGHSIRVESKEEMIRLGYMDPPPVVDMETGEEVQMVDTLSPKEIVRRQTQQSRRSAM